MGVRSALMFWHTVLCKGCHSAFRGVARAAHSISQRVICCISQLGSFTSVSAWTCSLFHLVAFGSRTALFVTSALQGNQAPGLCSLSWFPGAVGRHIMMLHSLKCLGILSMVSMDDDISCGFVLPSAKVRLLTLGLSLRVPEFLVILRFPVKLVF